MKFTWSALLILPAALASLIAAADDDAAVSPEWVGTVVGHGIMKQVSNRDDTNGTYHEEHLTDGIFVLTIPSSGKPHAHVEGSGHWNIKAHSETAITCKGGAKSLEIDDIRQISQGQGHADLDLDSSPVEVTFNDDGTYGIWLDSSADAPLTVKGALNGRVHYRCGDRPDEITSSPFQMDMVAGTPRNGHAPTPPEGPSAQSLSGSSVDSAPDSYDFTLTWSLRRKDSDLKALTTKPVYAVARADSVTLDGSPSKGQVTEYVWTLEPTSECPADVPAQTVMKGKTVSFTVLCGMYALLTVRNAQGDSDLTMARVDVSARPAWKTEITHVKKEATLDEFVSKENAFLGKNRCATGEPEPNHWLHHTNPITWKDEGYSLTQIAEPGAPFHGFWYVDSQKLAITRQSWINSSLLAGGAVANLNGDGGAGNPSDLARLVRQIRRHEFLHTKVVKDMFKAAGPDWDPAQRIESVISSDLVNETTQADMEIRAVESDLLDTNWESVIKAIMHGETDFDRKGWILTKAPGGGTETWPIDSFADLDM